MAHNRCETLVLPELVVRFLILGFPEESWILNKLLGVSELVQETDVVVQGNVAFWPHRELRCRLCWAGAVKADFHLQPEVVVDRSRTKVGVITVEAGESAPLHPHDIDIGFAILNDIQDLFGHFGIGRPGCNIQQVLAKLEFFCQ